MQSARSAIFLAFASLAVSLPAGADVRVYAVGNSLTADAWHVRGVTNFAASRGIDYFGGQHVSGGIGLKDHWDRYQANIAPYVGDPAPFDVALPTLAWDAMIVQPFKNTAAQEIAAAKSILNMGVSNPQNADATIYVYAPPTELNANFQTEFTGRWLEPYQGEAVLNASTRAYFQTVYEDLRSTYSDRNVGVIPAGDVWAAVGAKIDAGQIAGVSNSNELYRDRLHASALGQLTTVATWYAVTLKQDPRGLTLGWGFGTTTQAQADAIFQATWDVVTADSARTLVLTPGDTNADFHVNFNDLLTLARHYQAPSAATWFEGDFNADLQVNFNDLLALAKHYESASFEADWALAQSMVPEPATAGMVAVGVAVLKRRRVRQH